MLCILLIVKRKSAYFAAKMNEYLEKKKKGKGLLIQVTQVSIAIEASLPKSSSLWEGFLNKPFCMTKETKATSEWYLAQK